MGMDLIVNVAVENHPERTVSELRQMVRDISVDQAVRIWEAVLQLDYDDLLETRDEAVSVVQGWLNEFLAVLNGEVYHRSILIYNIPDLGKRIAIGGGETWGDTPPGLDEVMAVVEWGQW